MASINEAEIGVVDVGLRVRSQGSFGLRASVAGRRWDTSLNRRETFGIRVSVAGNLFRFTKVQLASCVKGVGSFNAVDRFNLQKVSSQSVKSVTHH